MTVVENLSNLLAFMDIEQYKKAMEVMEESIGAIRELENYKGELETRVKELMDELNKKTAVLEGLELNSREEWELHLQNLVKEQTERFEKAVKCVERITKIEEYEEEIRNLKQRNSELSEDFTLGPWTNQVKVLHEKIVELEETNKVMTEAAVKHRDTADRLMKEYEKKIDDLRKEIHEKDEAISKLAGQNAKFSGQLNEIWNIANKEEE